jgi:Bacterial Ig-like domain
VNNKDYSRREFLRTFAALSTAPLLVNILGCGSDSGSGGGNYALYGPSPVAYGPNPVGVTVVRMIFLDDQTNQVALSGNQSVPVHTSFLIQFRGPMNVATVAAAITFADSNNSSVAFGTSWDQYDVNLTITPTADLVPNVNYTLAVDDNATDSNGTRLTVNANASASFKTAV